MPDGTPILTGDQPAEPTSRMARKCLKIIETYRRGTRDPLSKATAIQGITSLLTSAADELSESEINDTLGLYFKILKQYNKSTDIRD